MGRRKGRKRKTSKQKAVCSMQSEQANQVLHESPPSSTDCHDDLPPLSEDAKKLHLAIETMEMIRRA